MMTLLSNDVDAVYISTPITEKFDDRAIESGKHMIIENQFHLYLGC